MALIINNCAIIRTLHFRPVAYVIVMECIVVLLMVVELPDLAAHKVIRTEIITCNENVFNTKANNETGNSPWFVSLGKQ